MPKRRFTYTEKTHARRLLRILELNTCDCCPASRQYNSAEDAGFNWKNPEEVCKICWAFIGLDERSMYTCPCSYLGSEEAIEVSIKALKKRGYL